MSKSNVVEILIRLKDQTKAGFGAVQSAVSKVSESVFTLQNALAGLGVGLAVREIVTVFADFDDQMRAVGAISGATGEELARLTALAEEMGATTRYSASQAGEAMQYLFMAGLNVTDSMSALPGVLQLAAANAMDLGQAADIATNVMAGMSLGVSELSRVNDVLTKAAHSANTSVAELGEGMKVAGPAAEGSKMALEDVVSVLGGLADKGIKGAEGGNAVKRMLLLLQAPSAEASEAMDRLGVSTIDADGKFRGLVPVLKDLSAAQMDLTTSEKIFGAETATSGLAAANYAVQIENLRGKLDAAAGTSQRAAEAMEAGLGGAIRSLMSAWEGLKIAIGRGFDKDLTAMVGGLTARITEIRAAVVDLQQKGDIGRWAAAVKTGFNGLVEAGLATGKVFLTLIQYLEPVVSRLSALAPILIPLAAGWWALSKAVLAVQAAKVLYAATLTTQLGAALAANLAGVQTASVMYTQLGQRMALTQAATMSLSHALSVLAGVAAAAFVGWQVGKLINEMKLLGDGTVKVGERVQHMFKMMGKDTEDQSKNLDRLMQNFSKFALFRLPADFAKASNEQLVEFEANLKRSKVYWDAFAQSQQNALADLKIQWGANSEQVKSAEKSLAMAQKRMAEIEGQLKQVGKAEEDRAKAAEEASKKVEEATVKETAAKTKALAVTAEALAEETVKRKDALEHQLLAIEEAAADEVRIKQETTERKKDLDKSYDLSTALGAGAYVSAMVGLYEEDVQRKHESIKAKLELERGYYQDTLTRHDAQIAATRESYEKIKQIQEAGTRDLSAAEADLLKSHEKTVKTREGLDKEFSKFRVGEARATAEFAAEMEEARVAATDDAHRRIMAIIEAETGKRSARMAKDLAEIELQEARGVITAQEAATKKQEIELKWAEFKIAQARRAVTAAVEAYGEDSDAYQKAVTDRIQAEAELLGQQAAAAKTAAGATEELAQATEKAAEAREFHYANISAENNTLRELSGTINSLKESYRTMTTAMNPEVMSAYQKIWGDMQQSIDKTRESYQAIGREAAAAGLSVSTFDMTLAEATQDTAARIGAWTDFQETLRGISLAMDELGSTNVDGLAGARAAFDAAASSADVLVGMMGELNAAFGSGDLDAAKAMADEVIATYKTIYDRGKAYLDALKDEWQGYSDKVAEIQNQIEALNLSTEERIRELKRQTMTEEEQWLDKKLEYEEKMSAAALATRQKDREAAKAYYDEAMQIAESLATEVKDVGGETVSSLAQNTELAISLINKAKSAASQNLTEYAAENKSALDQTDAAIKQTTSFLDGLTGRMSGAINKITEMKRSMNFGEFADQNMNVDFTGTGSSKRPLMDKLKEVKAGLSSALGGIKDAAANVNFSGYAAKVGGAMTSRPELSPTGASDFYTKQMEKNAQNHAAHIARLDADRARLHSAELQRIEAIKQGVEAQAQARDAAFRAWETQAQTPAASPAPGRGGSAPMTPTGAGASGADFGVIKLELAGERFEMKIKDSVLESLKVALKREGLVGAY